MKRPRSLSPRGDLLGYLLFSHGWSWVFWGIVVVMGWDAFASPGVFFLIVGGTGPMLGGIVMSWVVGGSSELTDLRHRMTDPRRIPARWWPVVVGFFPAVTAGTALLAIGLGVTGQPITLGEASELFVSPPALLSTAVFILILGPLPEEIGWRGYLLDRLQLRWGALTASLLVGIVWLSWHGPLFLMQGYYDSFGGPPNPFTFATGVVVVSIFYTWVHNNTHRSLLAAIIFHFSQNFTGQVFDLTLAASVMQAVIFVISAGVVVLLWGPKELRQRGKRPHNWQFDWGQQ